VRIHSGRGGVGIAATQIAKHIGARIIGTASVAKHGELRRARRDHLIDYRIEAFEARARENQRGSSHPRRHGRDSLKKLLPVARANRPSHCTWRVVGRDTASGRFDPLTKRPANGRLRNAAEDHSAHRDDGIEKRNRKP
jgi:hypothetical protein